MDHPVDVAPVPPDALARTLQPLAASEGLPREAYTSPAVLAWELRRFFDESWVCVGRVEAFDEPGTQRAIRAGGEGVLVVRDAAGEIRAFYNVCRHRAHELVQIGECVRGPTIRCPYHAWTYELSGARRRGRLDPEQGDCGLLALRVEAWRGFLFVNLAGAAPPLSTWLGDLAGLTADHQLGELRVAATHEYELAANWKLVIENYHECYHCAQIHPQLSRVSPPSSGENFRGTGAWIGGPMALTAGVETMSLDGRSRGKLLPRLGPEQLRRVYYYGVGTNLLLSLHPDYVLTHRIEPLAVDRTRIECQWLFPADALAEPGFSPAYAVDFWDVTNRQDWRAVESVQRGVASRGYRPGSFTGRERAVHAFVTRVAAGYQQGGWPASA